MRAREAMAALENMKATNDLLKTQKNAEVFRGEQAATQAELNEAAAINMRQTTRFQELEQPSNLRLAGARALFEELMVPGMRNQADFERKLGTMHPALKFLFNSGKSITSMIQGVRSK